MSHPYVELYWIAGRALALHKHIQTRAEPARRTKMNAGPARHEASGRGGQERRAGVAGRQCRMELLTNSMADDYCATASADNRSLFRLETMFTICGAMPT